MGHIMFLILHLFAILFGFIFLFLTIPMHIIYTCIHDRAIREQRKLKKEVAK